MKTNYSNGRQQEFHTLEIEYNIQDLEKKHSKIISSEVIL